jgi:DNA-binding NtrC family response regulator
LSPSICLIEDDEIMGESLCDRFRLEGFGVDWHRSVAQAARALEARDYALVLSDVRLPDRSGESLYRELVEEGRSLPPFLFMTGYGTIDSAVRLMKLGAVDYVTKPFEIEALVERVRALTQSRAPAEPTLGVSAPMRSLGEALPRLATHAETLLLTGESGAGKEYVARELHRLAHRGAERPFVAVNCGAFAETLIESELFGHEKGAFTGALRQKRGVFEQARGGTLFLDEIGDMPLGMQVKLLRALQERRVVRVGGEAAIEIDFKLILATHRDLKKLVEQGAFREDLYYRINVIDLRIPALRERREDILWFARRFVLEFVRAHPGEQRRLHPLTEQALQEYPWPGNLRELRHTVERACILSQQQTILPEHCFADTVNPQKVGAAATANLSAYLQECERRYIESALEANGWQIARSAEELGISRKSLWEKMRRLGIREP